MSWELVQIIDSIETYRLRTNLGWIVLSEKSGGDGGHRITQCFVPDPFHWWKIKEDTK